MKQGSNNRRSRSRGGGKRHSGGGRNNFESNGPDVKIRGSAQQVQEKYLALARDASSAGDWISAEAFFQYAEHYYRIVNADPKNANGKGQSQGQSQGQNKGQGQGQGRGSAGAKKPPPSAEPEVRVPAAGDSQGVAEVTDTSPAALAAAVTERETEQTEAAESSKAADETEPKKAAS